MNMFYPTFLFCFLAIQNILLSKEPSQNNNSSFNVLNKNIEQLYVDDTLIPHKLFEIPTKYFFVGDAFNVIFSGNTHESGLYIPLKVSINQSRFYIPNPEQKKIYVFSKEGKKINEIPYPAPIKSVDFFEFLDDGTLVINNVMDGLLYEVDNQGGIVKKSNYYGFEFVKYNNNYIYLQNGEFIDRLHKFDSFKFDYPRNTYNYYLSGDTLFIASDENKYKDLKISINTAKYGNIENDTLKNLDLIKYCRPYILDVSAESMIILLAPRISQNLDFKVIHYNFKDKKYFVKNLKKATFDNDDPLIGEGVAWWCSGMIFTFEEGSLYLMYISKMAIKMFQYKISDS